MTAQAALLPSSESIAPATGVEIKVITSRAIATVLGTIGSEFERATGNRLNVITGYSPAVVKKLEAGEPFDVVVSLPKAIDELVRGGKVIAETRRKLVRAGNGVEVRAGAAKPDISSVEAFKRALMNAKSLGYLAVSGVPELVERLGIAGAIRSRVTMPNADIVSELVAKGELEVGVIVTTQILTTPGVDLVGPLPPEIQIYATFEGAVSANSKRPDAARALIEFLTGPVAIPVIKAQGMEPC
jgi:molybdate transport system substrate-binding protein